MQNAFRLSESGSKWRALAAQIAKDVLSPNAAEVDSGQFPREGMKALAERKLNGLCVAAEFGGAGEGPRTFAAVVEELAAACGSTAMVYVMHVSAAQAIASSKGLSHRTTLLTDIAAGRHLSTLALSEKGSRSQFWAPVSKLQAAASGYRTSAQKSWVTSANEADSYVSSAQKPGARSPLESTIYLVRKGASGVRVSGKFEGLGLRGNDSAPVTIEDFQLQDGDLVSEQGAGAKTMLEVILPWFAVGTSAMAVGLGRAAVQGTAYHLSSTSFEHTGGKLRDLATLRARLAEMSARVDQARALLAYTCGEMEHPNESTPLYVLETRLSALEMAVDVTDQAMKSCGGAAFSKQLPVERLFRDARAGWVMAPTSDHLSDFIGRALTGMPLFE